MLSEGHGLTKIGDQTTQATFTKKLGILRWRECLTLRDVFKLINNRLDASPAA